MKSKTNVKSSEFRARDDEDLHSNALVFSSKRGRNGNAVLADKSRLVYAVVPHQ
jgi:hypothetical protein